MSVTNPADVPGTPVEAISAPSSINKLLRFPGSQLVLPLVSVVVLCALVAAALFDLSPYLGEEASNVRDIARWRYGEYLFFIGTTYFALLLLRRKKWIRAPLVFGAGILWASFYGSAMDFVGNLGSDSVSEAQNFDLSEAWFWLQTLRQMITPNFDGAVMAYYVAAACASYLVIRFALRLKEITSRYYSHVKIAIAALLIGAALYLSLSDAVRWFAENTETYTGAERNFKQKVPAVVAGGKGVDMLVYVGESTAAMNMGIYGYPRDTTPKLQKLKDSDSNLIVFKPLFSTHTHTSPSLMEALSFAVDRKEYYVPIDKRKRLSIVDLMVANKIPTTLASNQGQNGTWSLASSIIFKHARTRFSVDTRFAGNNEYKIAKPWDDVFFRQAIGDAFAGPDEKTQVAFFHSYAGHGGYWEYTPPAFQHHLTDNFGRTRPAGDPQADAQLSSEVEDYDATMRYIDHSVARAIEYVRQQSRPIVFVYFSDHGESPYTGRAHDSGQYIHEMSRVPFMIYFNDAARAKLPAKYKKYRALSTSGNDATMEQLASTMLDLVNIRIKPDPRRPVVEWPVIGEKVQAHPPIVVRATSSGVTFVNINRKGEGIAAPANVQATEHRDETISIYTAAKDRTNPASRVCAPAVDAADKLVRSHIAAGCIEVAVSLDKDGALTIPGAAATDAGLRLQDVLKLASANDMRVWMRAPDVQGVAQCEGLANALQEHGAAARSLMVEFPAGSHKHAKELKSCTSRLAELGVASSYRVADADASECARAIAAGGRVDAARSCTRMRKDLTAARRSRMFTDIGFDHGAVAAIEAMKAAKAFRWNTWNVAPADYSGDMSEQFTMTILRTAEPAKP